MHACVHTFVHLGMCICVHILVCACSYVHACVCVYSQSLMKVVWCTFIHSILHTVISTLEEIERDVTLNGSKLPESLQKLRLILSHWHICNVAENQGLTHSSQLPMVTPPAGIPPHSVYIKHSLIDGVYIVS